MTSVERPIEQPRSRIETAPRYPWVGFTSWLALAISAVLWLTFLHPWNWSMGDLEVYRVGASAVLHGRNLYGFQVGKSRSVFTYPPFAAQVMIPLAIMHFWAAKLILSVLSFSLLFVVIRVALRDLEGFQRPATLALMPAVCAAAIWLEPFRSTLRFGQINVVLLALIVVDFVFLRNKPGGGWLTGVAAAIKLTPLAFVPFFFIIGRRRQSINAAASFVVCGVISALFDLSGSREYWIDRRFMDPHHVGRAENASNQSIRGVLARQLRTTSPPSWWLLIAFAALVVGLACAAYLWRRGRQLWALMATSITMLLISPISWSHHWVWAALFLVVSLDIFILWPRWRLILAAVLPILMFPYFSGMIFWPPHLNHLELRDSHLQQFVSATYVISGALFVALLTVAARALPQTSAGVVEHDLA